MLAHFNQIWNKWKSQKMFNINIFWLAKVLYENRKKTC